MREKCEKCGKQTEINVELVWIKWNYDADTEEYTDMEILLDSCPDESIFLCKRCYQDGVW